MQKIVVTRALHIVALLVGGFIFHIIYSLGEGGNDYLTLPLSTKVTTRFLRVKILVILFLHKTACTEFMTGAIMISLAKIMEPFLSLSYCLPSFFFWCPPHSIFHQSLLYCFHLSTFCLQFFHPSFYTKYRISVYLNL